MAGLMRGLALQTTGVVKTPAPHPFLTLGRSDLQWPIKRYKDKQIGSRGALLSAS
jgi:hypothetical protein